MDPVVNIFGPLDALQAEVYGGVSAIEYILLVLVLVNIGTRFLAHRDAVKQAENGEDLESVARYLPHEASNVVLILATFYYTTVEPHGGVVMSMLVVGMFLADFFEAEVRNVDVRAERKPRAPKGAVGASVLVLAYALFQSLFFLVKGIWTAII
ncbi:DUF7313 family protein [Haloarchaeobius sp. TZWWS8]|uniref:DUF7313 family protein n=1 Tax=Haloarchaeobius sp. TZWWS8 TaxID=3446121 RepID=UPI003EBC0688